MPVPKVTFLSATLGPGGAERQLYYMALALRRLGATPQVLTFGRAEYWERELLESGISTECVGERPIVPFRLARILAALKAARPDFIQCAHFYTAPYALAAARILGIKEIGAIRSDFHLEIEKLGILGGPSCRRLRRIALNSRAAMRQAVEFGFLPERLRYLPNQVDTGFFRPGPRRVGQPVRILMVARFVPIKRHDRILEAFRAVLDQVSRPCVLDLVGDGPLRESIEEEVRRSAALSRTVRIHPTTRRVIEHYHNSDILALTSDNEGMPNVVLEAMACGLPVVAGSVGGIPELLTDGETGFLCAPTTASSFVAPLIQLINDGSLRENMGRRARERVSEEFSLNTFPKRLTEFYDWAGSVG